MDPDRLRQEKTKDHGPVKRTLVIQGSPRGERGWTDHCLKRVIEGLDSRGVSHESVYLRKLDIRHCLGCIDCWFKTPGVCVQKDDMAGVLGKMNQADLWIYAVPLYFYSVTGLFKDFMDRTLPLALPNFEKDANGSITHPPRHPEPKRLVLLSVCGFPELEHFDALRGMLAKVYRSGPKVLVGELLRPSAESMRARKHFAPAYDKAMQALVEAGRELAGQGYVSRAVEQAVSTPFFADSETFRTLANRAIEAHLAKLAKKTK